MKKFTRVCKLLLLLLIVQSGYAQLNGTYSIGAASVPGQAGNYATFAAAITALNSGGVSGPCIFYFSESKTYTEAADFGIGYIGGSALNTVTFKPYTGISCTINFTSNTTRASGIDGSLIIGAADITSAPPTTLISTNYILIDGSNTIGGTTKDLTIQNSGITATKSLVRVFGNSNNLTIKNCILTSSTTSSSTNAAINITNYFSTPTNYNPNNITIQNNTINAIAGTLSTGIHTANSGAPTVGANALVIRDNIINGNLRGVFVSYTNGGDIYNNTISVVSTGTTTNVTAYGITVQTNFTAGTFNIYNNNLVNLTTNTTAAAGASNGIIGIDNQCVTPKVVNIYNNVIRGFATAGAANNARIYGIRNTSTSTTSIYNNSIYLPEMNNMVANNNIAGIAYATALTAEASPSAASSCIIKNNAIHIDESTMKVWAIRRVGTSGNFTSDNNILFVNAGNALGNVGFFNATDYAILSDWQTNSGQDGASYNVNPNFTSATNLLPTLGYPGALLSSVPNDITGATRDNAPTIGAYEAGTMIGGVWRSTAANVAWGVNTNWRNNTVPTAGTNIFVPAGALNFPSLAATHTCATLTNYGTINLAAGANIGLTANLTNNGTINCADDGIILNGSAAQRIFGNGTIGILNINNSTGVSVNSLVTSDSVKIINELRLTAGALTTNGRVTLLSSASSTARIPTIVAGSITGSLNIQRYIAGGGSAFPGSGNSKRGFRFIGHPFSAAIGLSQLNGANEFSITGSGGSTNGFQTSTTNNPSAFWYNPTVLTAGDNTTIGSGGAAAADAGWQAFTHTDGLLTNAWGVGQGIRFLYRGNQTQGLTSNTDYTVNPANTTVAGLVNVGPVIINLTSNAANSKGFNVLGNPLPSPVDLSLTTSRTNMGANFWVFDPSIGNRGGYSAAKPFSSSYILPLGGAFVAEVSTLGSASSITFPEAAKATTPTDNLFRTTNQDNYVKLRLEGPNMFWDELNIVLGNQYKPVTEYIDGAKFLNSDVNFYSITKDNNRLSLDYRKLSEGESVPLGLVTNSARSFTLKATDVNLTVGEALYLKDNYLHTETKLKTGIEYEFSTNADAASQGEARFEIGIKKIPIALLQTEFTIKLSPNPAKDMVTVSFNNLEAANTTLTFVNAEGKIVKTIQAGNVQTGVQRVNVKDIAKGIYYVNLTNGIERKTEKLVIQ